MRGAGASMKDLRIAVVGLGYVGLPLAIAFARKHEVIGFDVSRSRIHALRTGHDWTNEISPEELSGSRLQVTDEASALAGSNIFVVTVPTPIGEANRPDFGALLSACELIGPALSRDSVVVFESTVYPGVTEDICGPALERASGLRRGIDFKLGYSPERINPGDKQHPLEKITKVVAAQDENTLELLSELYGSIIEAGIHRASSIKVAEAAKVLENTQRDVNIALMNEVSKICDLVGIRSSEVLAAAGTKWNFLRFHPGLVGGHCIGVDPYYLTAKAEQLGYHPQVILSGRRINDSMGAYVAQRVLKLLANARLPGRDVRVGIMGFTFKENVPDTRNSKIVDLYRELCDFGVKPIVHDPLADEVVVKEAYGIELSPLDHLCDLHALVLAVAHDDYARLSPSNIGARIVEDGVLVDLRCIIDPQEVPQKVTYWSL